MKLLVTGAWKASPDQLDQLRALGHQIIWMQQEAEPLPVPPSEIEGCICNGLFLSHPIEEFTALRYIQLTSAGFDRVPLDYIQVHQIEIHNARGVYSIPMAEHALAGVLALYRHLFEFRQSQQNHQWNKIRSLRELNGSRVLILGCGSVGTECARRFQAFGCQVTGLDLFPRDNEAFSQVDHIRELDAWLPRTDILLVTLPRTPETINLIDTARLALLPDQSLVCNIARGGIINEEALAAELCSARLSACLDVFDTEPLSSDSPFWNLPNVQVTPHNSFVGEGNGKRLFQVIYNNLIEHNYSK